jgi:hypothetical protein
MTADPINLATLEFLRGLVRELEAGRIMITAMKATDPAEDEPGSAGLGVRWRALSATPAHAPAPDVDTSPARAAPHPLCCRCRSPRVLVLGDGAVCQDCGAEQ